MKIIFFLFAALISFSSVSHSDDSHLFESGKAQFQKYLESKETEIRTKAEDPNNKNHRIIAAPFVLLHEGRTKYSALLIHGLNDSPYYMKDIAQVLFSQGYNVITILLDGHGTSAEDMKTTTYIQWIKNLYLGLSIAKKLGENVLVGGFSTGGLLSTYAALDTTDVKGILLFAPALAIQDGDSGNRYGAWSCAPIISSQINTAGTIESPVKYKMRSINAYCQLVKMISETYERVGANPISKFTTTDADTQSSIIKIAEKINVPTFLAMTSIDGRVPLDKLMLFYQRLNVQKEGIIYTPDRSTLAETFNLDIVDFALKHHELALRTNPYNEEYNQKFDALEASIKNFLANHFK